MSVLLQVSDIRKVYGADRASHTALNGLSFSITKGEFVAIMGPSGSGKTTLLNMLAGLDTPTSGMIQIGQHSLSGLSLEDLAHFRRTQLGFVFQDYNLLDTLTLGENIVLPLLLEKKIPNHRLEQVLKMLGISELEERFPHQVSGGQQQRAAIARAIIHQPALVLADEPSGNLDSKAATDLLETFSALNRKPGITFVMVTHDPHAASYARRVIFIKDGHLYKELERRTQDDRMFYSTILDTLGQLEGALHA